MIIGQELIHIVSAPTLFFMEIKSVMRKGVMRKGVRHLGKFSFAEKGSGPAGHLQFFTKLDLEFVW